MLLVGVSGVCVCVCGCVIVEGMGESLHIISFPWSSVNVFELAVIVLPRECCQYTL